MVVVVVVWCVRPASHLVRLDLVAVVVVVQHGRLETAAAAGRRLAGGQGGGCRGHHSCSALLALARGGREVGAVEELREEHEVAEVHGDRELDVHRGDVAAAAGRLDERVRPHVDRTAHHHLRQLQRRDEHRDEARRVEAHRSQRVVRVHERVHAVVHGDEPARRRGVLRVAEPGVHEHGDVVVPVQEDQRLFPQHNEERVAQLGQFGEHKQPCPEAGHFVLLDEAKGGREISGPRDRRVVGLGTHLGMHTEWNRPWCLSTCMSSGAVLNAPIMLNMANIVFQITKSPRSSYLGRNGAKDRVRY